MRPTIGWRTTSAARKRTTEMPSIPSSLLTASARPDLPCSGRSTCLGSPQTTIRLRTPETAANLAKVSPTGTVPVLMHGERVIWETLAILEYLADLFPDKKLWPDDREARALARCVATEMHSGFLELRYGWPMNLRRPKAHKPLEGIAAEHERRIKALWRQCRAAHGDGGPFLFGHFTAADAMYAPVVTRFDTYGGPLDPDIRTYVDAVLATPAMRQWYAEAAKEPWPEPSPDE